ncbi:MAG: sulfide/dihydroorotate dehydrogenase-like FAD/NAD-binding protein [Omnitrophica bacterium]|nr:sulfide/dihydroorotate dehydrogenase-like FAD/NAD-binding protein [Candidatus Omnitrophota bacterium]
MKIINKQVLTEAEGVRTTKIEVESPLIAEKARPGQFVILMVSEEGERIPLTVVSAKRDMGTITLIFQEVGFTTKLLGKLNTGDSLYALTGPMGHATEIKNYGKVILIGGGVGIAEIYPITKALKEAGNSLAVIIGARTKKLLILEKELKETANEFYVTTDDGSYGRKGFVTDVLKELLAYNLKLKAYSLIYAVGPIPMMKKVSHVSRDFNIKTLVSLNSLMVDATGMCGGCRVNIKGKAKFTCMDGPEFDAHDVDWEGLEKRSKIYSDKEKHICKLYNL